MDLPKEPSFQAPVRAEPIFSTKALIAGTLGSLCIAVGAPYGNMVIRGSYMSIDFSAAGALFLFFVLTGLFNALLTRFAAPCGPRALRAHRRVHYDAHGLGHPHDGP